MVDLDNVTEFIQKKDVIAAVDMNLKPLQSESLLPFFAF